MNITIREALSLWFLKGAVIIAGNKGIDHEIKSVNIMEVPDIVNYVKPGELLLTTAYPIKDDTEAQANLIPDLHAKKLAGLAIKPQRFIDKIPDIMIQQANQLNFPLIQLPPDAAFAEIMVPLVSEIINRQAARLQRTDEVHKKLTRMVLKGDSLDKILKTLFEIIEQPVSIHLRNFEVMASWEVENIKNKCESLREAVGENCPTINLGLLHCKIFEVKVDDEVYAYLCVWLNDNSLREDDIYAIEETLTVIALEITKREAVLEVERHYKNQFFMSLIYKPEGTKEDIIARAATLGIDLTGQYRLAILTTQALDETNVFDAQRYKRDIMEVANVLKPGMNIFDMGNRLVILFQCRNNDDTYQVNLKRLIHDGAMMIKAPINAGVSNIINDVSDLGRGFHEALEAVNVCARVSPGQFKLYSDIGAYKLLMALRNDSRSQAFCEEVLNELINYDKKCKGDLLETLKALLEFNLNITEVSRHLFLHYNTVRYRLDKIVELTGYNPLMPQDRFAFEMALYLLDLNETSPKKNSALENVYKKLPISL